MMTDIINILTELTARTVEGYCLYLLFGTFGEQKSKQDGQKQQNEQEQQGRQKQQCEQKQQDEQKRQGRQKQQSGQEQQGRQEQQNEKGMAKDSQKGQREIINAMMIILTWFLASKAISCFVFWDNSFSFGRGLLSLTFRACAAYLIGTFFYRAKYPARLFVVLMFVSLTYISAQIGGGMGVLLVYGVDKMAGRIDALNNLTLVQGMVTAISVIRDAVTIALPFLSVKFLVKNQKYAWNKRDTKEIISYMLPAIFGSLAAVILYFIFFILNKNGYLMDSEHDIWMYLSVAIVFLAIWLAVLYSFKLEQELIGQREEQIQKSVLENQISQMQNSMVEMEDFYENIRHVKHDMKNQMAVMENLLNEKRITGEAEMLQYFGDMQKTLSQLEQEIHTGNVVSDAVISSKFHYARKEIEGICLDAEGFVLTDKIPVRAYDIGIILNNGLDNAIEACKRQHLCHPEEKVYIKIKSFWKQKMFFIEMENSFDGIIEWGVDGYPCSRKPDGRLHGIGLKNIRHCALKYMGDIDCIVRKDRFILSVMIKGKT